MDTVGLYNEDNILCYQAAVVQALFNNAGFREILVAHHFRPKYVHNQQIRSNDCSSGSCPACCREENCALCLTARLYRVYATNFGHYKAICQESMTELGRRFLDRVVGRDQQDAAEFWDVFCDSVTLKSTSRHDFVEALGDHVINQHWRCLEPQCTSLLRSRSQHNWGLDCSIRGGIEEFGLFQDIPLESALHRYLGPEIINNRCSEPSCPAGSEKLYGEPKCAQTTYLMTTSKHLVIKSNFFENVDDGGTNIFTWPVIIPSTLDLHDYVDSTSDNVTREKSTFSLNAVVCHSGNLRQGHYKTVLRNDRGCWIEANDRSISLLACRTQRDREFEAINGYPPAAEAAWSLAGWSPRMIFYVREQ